MNKYVSRTLGSNSNAGTFEAPWQTITYAVTQVVPGDILNILEGDYTENCTLSVNGTALDPITIQGIGTVTLEKANQPIFATSGISFYIFKNLEVYDSQSLLEVASSSHDITVEDCYCDGSRFFIRINNSYNIRCKNIITENNRYGFRGHNGAHDLYFENCEAYNAQDTDISNPDYLNGDGFVFETDVYNVTVRNCISGNNWDAGIDCKSDNVIIENSTFFGCKNNMKLWGSSNVKVKNCFSHHALRQDLSGGGSVEGNGIVIEASGNVEVENSIFMDNEDKDIAVYEDATLTLSECIVARKSSTDGVLVDLESGAELISTDTIWFDENGEDALNHDLGSGDEFTRPEIFGWSVDWENQYKNTRFGVKNGSRVKLAFVQSQSREE